MKKQLAILLIIFFFPFLLTGCWDRREINELTFVVLVGVDKEENGDIKLTMEIPTAATLQGMVGGGAGGGGGRGQESPVIIIESTGRTIFDAIRNAATFTTPPLFWAHLRAVIFSEEVARDGISKYMDFFARDSELRGTVWVLIAQGKAGDIVKNRNKYTQLAGEYIEQLVQGTERVGVAPAVNLETFLEHLISPKGNDPFAPRIQVKEEPQEAQPEGQEAQGQGNQQESGQGQGPQQQKKDLLLEGTAVLKKDKLVGWLDRNESRGLLWLQGDVGNALEVVEYSGTKNGLIVEEIIKINTKIDVQKTNEGMVFRVQINQNGNLAEQTFPKDLTKLDKIQSVEKLLNKQIEDEVRAALKKLQEEYNSDIIGLGGIVAKKYPKLWEKMDWEKEFPRAKVMVSVNTKIRRSGMILRPPFPKD